jgi:hypothetical protein
VARVIVPSPAAAMAYVQEMPDFEAGIKCFYNHLSPSKRVVLKVI